MVAAGAPGPDFDLEQHEDTVVALVDLLAVVAHEDPVLLNDALLGQRAQVLVAFILTSHLLPADQGSF